MKLLFATGNNKKYELMKNRLKDINQIEVLMPRQIGVNIKVNENGKTAIVSMDETMLGHYDMMKIGKQTIEVKRLNKTASFTINVNPIPVKQITLDKTQLVLKKGETATLTATISPENAPPVSFERRS